MIIVSIYILKQLYMAAHIIWKVYRYSGISDFAYNYSFVASLEDDLIFNTRHARLGHI